MNLNIISGENVDMISPFPAPEARRVFGWSHCYRTLSESDDTPTDEATFTERILGLMNQCPTWGVIDKNRLTNSKHEAPLIGIVIFEPIGLRAGYLHFASARKAFKMQLMDEALELVVRFLFEQHHLLLRLGAYMDEKNGPAKYLFRQLGFRFEGCFEDAVLHLGVPKSVAYFGLTKRAWVAQVNEEQPPEFAEPMDVQEIDLSLAEPSSAA